MQYIYMRFKKISAYRAELKDRVFNHRDLLQVEAIDQDKTGTKNSRVRYEIIKGNYEKKFSIDENTGVISVTEPLVPVAGRTARALGDDLDPIITLHVRSVCLCVCVQDLD